MSWRKIKYDSLPVTPERVEKIVSEQSIHRRGKQKRPGLNLVPLPEKYFFKKYLIKQRHVIILRALRSGFGNKLFSFKEAIKLLKPHDLKCRVIARTLATLWAHSKLEKFAVGEFEEGLSRQGEVGKYYGVHYRCL